MKSLSISRILLAIVCVYGSLFVLWIPLGFITLVGLNPLFGCYDSGGCWFLIPQVIEIPSLFVLWCALWAYGFIRGVAGADRNSFLVMLVLIMLPGLFVWVGSYLLGPAAPL